MSDHCTSLSIAIIDDDPQLVTLYRYLFCNRKIAISFVAYDGFTALEQFVKANPRPPILIVDYRMPVMDGIQLTKELLRTAPDTKIVIVSADASVRSEALSAGASAFLDKPAGVNDIMDCITALEESLHSPSD